MRWTFSAALQISGCDGQPHSSVFYQSPLTTFLSNPSIKVSVRVAEAEENSENPQAGGV